MCQLIFQLAARTAAKTHGVIVMRTLKHFTQVVLFSFLFYGLTAHCAELKLGSVANEIPAVMYQRLSPLSDYLSEELHQNVTLQLSADMPAAIDAVVKKQVHISYLTPVAYLKAHKEGKARLVVKTVTKGQSSFQLMIAVKQDSMIKSVKDLAGKTFAFGDPAAKLQPAVVTMSGAKVDQFSDIKYLGHYDNIARAVMSGEFDAGILKDTDAMKWDGHGLRIIYSSPPLPPYNIVVNGDVSDALYKKIQAAFLKLDAKNPKHLAVIQSLDKEYTGFERTSDAEYDIIRKLTAKPEKTK